MTVIRSSPFLVGVEPMQVAHWLNNVVDLSNAAADVLDAEYGRSDRDYGGIVGLGDAVRQLRTVMERLGWWELR